MASLIPATSALPPCELSSSRKILPSPFYSSSLFVRPSRTHFLLGSCDVSQPRWSLFLTGGSSSSQGFWWPFVCAQRPARDSARPFALRVVNSQKKQLVTGSKGEPKVLQSRTPTSWDASKALAVTEGLCIVVAAASYTTSVLKKHQQSFIIDSSSSVTSKVLSKVGGLSTWYVPALWVALVINAVLRWVQRKPQAKWGERSIRDFSVDQRVGKLEEDVHDLTISAQMLSRHLEKLGVRFRATRRTMRDPIQETVELMRTTSKVVTALAKREESLERELRETQQVLSAMQEQQVKQLELLRAGMTKNLRLERIFEERISKELSQRLSEVSQNIVGAVPVSNEDVHPKSRRQTVMKGLGNFWRGLVTNEEASTSTSVPRSSLEKEKVAAPTGPSEAPDLLGKERPDYDDEREENAIEVSSSSKSPQSDKSVYYPDTSFSKEDFWATTTTESPGEEAPSRSTAEAERTTDARLQYSASSESKGGPTGKLDSFFSSRKGFSINQSDLRSQSGDFDNSSGVKQSYPKNGDHHSNGSSMW